MAIVVLDNKYPKELIVMRKPSNRSVAQKFRQCGVGSEFLIVVGAVYKRNVPLPQTATVRVERTFHTEHDLTFEGSLDGKRVSPTKRFLNYDIRNGLWTYVKEEKRRIVLRGEPRVVTHIEIV